MDTGLMGKTKALDYKKAIENEAKSYFAELQPTMPTSIIGNTLSYFEFHLHKQRLDDDFDEDSEVCHSKPIVITSRFLIDIEDIIFAVSRIYGTKPVKLINYGGEKVKYSITYVGYKHETHACYVTLKKAIDFAKEAKKQIKASIDKDLSKKEQSYEIADLFMDWVEDFARSLHPTALTREIFDDIDQYIDTQFSNHKEYLACQKSMLEFVKMLTEVDPKSTNRQVMDIFYKKHGVTLEELDAKFRSLGESNLALDW